MRDANSVDSSAGTGVDVGAGAGIVPSVVLVSSALVSTACSAGMGAGIGALVRYLVNSNDNNHDNNNDNLIACGAAAGAISAAVAAAIASIGVVRSARVDRARAIAITAVHSVMSVTTGACAGIFAGIGISSGAFCRANHSSDNVIGLITVRDLAYIIPSAAAAANAANAVPIAVSYIDRISRSRARSGDSSGVDPSIPGRQQISR